MKRKIIKNYIRHKRSTKENLILYSKSKRKTVWNIFNKETKKNNKSNYVSIKKDGVEITDPQ